MTLTPRQRFREAFLADIQAKRWVIGELLPSERALTEAYGVSRTTVREALEQLVSEGMIERIPGVGTRLLRTSAVTQGRRFGFVVPWLQRDFCGQMADGFALHLQESGFELVVHVYQEDHAQFERTIRQMAAQGFDGVAVTVPRHFRVEHARLLEQAPFPVVAMSRPVPLSIDQIVIDNVRVGELATLHLLKRGHRRIAHLGILDYQTGRDRLQGYRRALEAFGVAYDPELVVDLTRYASIRRGDAVRELLSRGVDMSAIAAFNDRHAVLAIQALWQAGLKVPDDVAVMGIDNQPNLTQVMPGLSTVHINWTGMGEWAAARLLARAGGADAPQPAVVVCETEVLQRETCKSNVKSENAVGL